VAVTCTDAGVPGTAGTTAYSSWLQETSSAPATVTFTNALENSDWGSYANWTPDSVPISSITAVIGDVNVKSPVTAVIGAGQNAFTKDLTLGNNTGASGSLNMSGGTLTGNGNVTVGSAAGSTGVVQMTGGVITNVGTLTIGSNLGYGDMTVSGSGAVYASYVNLSPTGGLSCSLTVTNNGFVRYLYNIGGGADGMVTVTLAGNSTSYGEPAAGTTVGTGARSTGRLYVRNNATFIGNSGRSLTLGLSVGSTGIVEVSDNGVITNLGQLAVGYAGGGYGSCAVRNSGKVFVSGASGVSIGGTNNNSILTVADDGEVRAGPGTTYVGNSAGSSGTLTVTNNGLFVCGAAGNWLQVGQGNNSIGWVNVNGGMISLPGAAARLSALGVGTGATGVLTITSGVYSNADSGGNTFSIGYGANSAGRVQLQGGTLYMAQATTLGAAAGAVGSITNTGGTWVQIGTLGVGVTASGTGLVAVANTVQTNISGAVTVGGGAMVGNRYGSVTVSNATFGGGTAMTVLTNGFVELTGTGSVLRCSTFTCRGGSLTNRVRQLAGGLDVTSSANTALVITNGGSVYLLFDEGPAGGVSGNFWGLRWAGNHAAELAAMTNASTLAWGGAAAGSVVIYTNASHTFVGYFINTAPVVTNAGKSVEIAMSEDGAPTAWAAATLYATDAEGDTLTWTNGTVIPANGSVLPINIVSSNLASYTYTPATNWNGTNTFTVYVSDGRGRGDTCTVTVVVAPVNDAPVCTARPVVTGLPQPGQSLTNSDVGVWNDALDTLVSGSSSFAFTRQWQWATNSAGLGLMNVPDATNQSLTLAGSDTGRYVRVAVTCTDDGVGSGGSRSATSYSDWKLVTVVTELPVITNGAGPVTASVTEDAGEVDLQALLRLGATDADPGQQVTLVWTALTSPSNGVAAVSGMGPIPVITYRPNTNWNGIDGFVVRVTDPAGATAEITVQVNVAAVNDPPVNTVLPVVSGWRQVGSNLTVTAGTWNDDIDTNAQYPVPANLSIRYQWWRADMISPMLGAIAIPGATNQSYTLQPDDWLKHICVAEQCVDDGHGLGGARTGTAYSVWRQMVSAENWPGLNGGSKAANSSPTAIGTNLNIKWMLRLDPQIRNGVYSWPYFTGSMRSKNIVLREGEIALLAPDLAFYDAALGGLKRTFPTPLVRTGGAEWNPGGVEGRDLRNGQHMLYWHSNGWVHCRSSGDNFQRAVLRASDGAAGPYLGHGAANSSGYFLMSDNSPWVFQSTGEHQGQATYFAMQDIYGSLAIKYFTVGNYFNWCGSMLMDGEWVYTLGATTHPDLGWANFPDPGYAWKYQWLGAMVRGQKVVGSEVTSGNQNFVNGPSGSFNWARTNRFVATDHDTASAVKPWCLGDDHIFVVTESASWTSNSATVDFNQPMVLTALSRTNGAVAFDLPLGITGTGCTMSANFGYYGGGTTWRPQVAYANRVDVDGREYVSVLLPEAVATYGWLAPAINPYGSSASSQTRISMVDARTQSELWTYLYPRGGTTPVLCQGVNTSTKQIIAGNALYVAYVKTATNLDNYVSTNMLSDLSLYVDRFALADGTKTSFVFPLGVQANTLQLDDLAAAGGKLYALITYREWHMGSAYPGGGQALVALGEAMPGNAAPVFTSGPTASPASMTPLVFNVTLSAMATDPDGPAPFLAWNKVSGPAAIAFSVNNSPSATNVVASFQQAGTYVIECRATDGDLGVTGTVQVIVNPDANTNGIPDVWETGYFGSTTNAEGAAGADWDKDGLSNYGEWMAGTDPTNSTSAFRFTNVMRNVGAGLVLRWSSESNRYYTVKLSTNLISDPFSTILTNRMPASPPVNVHTDAVERPCGAFYRVIVVQ
jgi:hypothetical protein